MVFCRGRRSRRFLTVRIRLRSAPTGSLKVPEIKQAVRDGQSGPKAPGLSSPFTRRGKTASPPWIATAALPGQRRSPPIEPVYKRRCQIQGRAVSLLFHFLISFAVIWKEEDSVWRFLSFLLELDIQLVSLSILQIPVRLKQQNWCLFRVLSVQRR